MAYHYNFVMIELFNPISSMKKKSPSQSAFLSLRVLIGLAVFLSGICLALAGLGTFSNAQKRPEPVKELYSARRSNTLLRFIACSGRRPKRSVFTSR